MGLRLRWKKDNFTKIDAKNLLNSQEFLNKIKLILMDMPKSKNFFEIAHAFMYFYNSILSLKKHLHSSIHLLIKRLLLPFKWFFSKKIPWKFLRKFPQLLFLCTANNINFHALHQMNKNVKPAWGKKYSAFHGMCLTLTRGGNSFSLATGINQQPSIKLRFYSVYKRHE